MSAALNTEKVGDWRVIQLNDKCWAVQKYRRRWYWPFLHWNHACWDSTDISSFKVYHETEAEAKKWIDEVKERRLRNPR